MSVTIQHPLSNLLRQQMLAKMPRRTHSQNLTQNQPSKSQNQAPASDPPQRPGKDKAPEHMETGLAQLASQQAQLEGIMEVTNHAVHTIKELLERMVLP